MSEKDGGPAFPYSALDPQGPQMYADNTGMSLRDYFAGQALAGLSAVPEDRGFTFPENAAEWAYKLADAMLQVREEQS
jgi:hypothetical protein